MYAGKDKILILPLPSVEANLPTPPAIRIITVDSQPMFLDGLKTTINSISVPTQIISELTVIETLYESVACLLPDLILMELASGPQSCSGVDVTRRIKADFPRTQIIILSNDDSTDTVLEVLRAGASGYLLKSSTAKELRDAILVVLSHGSALSPEITRKPCVNINDCSPLSCFSPSCWQCFNYPVCGVTSTSSFCSSRLSTTESADCLFSSCCFRSAI